MTQKYVNELFNFIASSPTCFHNVALVKSILNSYNYQELKESATWPLEKGKNYYVIRDDASIIAFKIPNNFEDAVCTHISTSTNMSAFHINMFWNFSAFALLHCKYLSNPQTPFQYK